MLYNTCKVLVLPSIHEGFGLPALEAMSCGAPVIASNVTSLPEVVGNPEALFDPGSDKNIIEKIEQVLRDENFRMSLAESGYKRSNNFSWERSAQKALEAIESSAEEIKRYKKNIEQMSLQGFSKLP